MDGDESRQIGTGGSLVVTPEHVILRRQQANRADLIRHDVSDLVMQAHLESFEVPEPDEPVVIPSTIHPST